MSNIEPHRPQQGVELSKRSQRELAKGQQEFALALFRDEANRAMVATRIQGGAVLTGELGFWTSAFSAEQEAMEQYNPLGAARLGYLVDQFALNGAGIVGNYMRGQ
jgi:hypothetical protein